MATLLRDTWKYSLGFPDNPIYRRELTGWTYLGLWRSLRQGCLPIIAIFVMASAGGCGLLSLTIETDIGFLIGGAIAGVFVAGEFVRWLTGLIATALTATTISAEVESETFDLLRTTLMTPRQIVLAKFGAALRQVRFAMFLPTLTRAFTMISSIVLIILLIVREAALSGPVLPSPTPAPQPLPPSGSLPDMFPLVSAYDISLVGLLIFLGVLALVAGLFNFLFLPVIRTMLFAAVGMLGSAYARTRAGGLLTGGGIRVGLWAVGYVSGQIISAVMSLVAVPLSAIQALPPWMQALLGFSDAAYVVFGLLVVNLWIILTLVGHVGIILLLLNIAAKRTERLAVSTS